MEIKPLKKIRIVLLIYYWGDMSAYGKYNYAPSKYRDNQEDSRDYKGRQFRDSMNYSASDQMLNINGDLKSGFSAQKPANNGRRDEPKLNNNENYAPNDAEARMKYRKSMVFSIEMNEDQEVAD